MKTRNTKAICGFFQVLAVAGVAIIVGACASARAADDGQDAPAGQTVSAPADETAQDTPAESEKSAQPAVREEEKEVGPDKDKPQSKGPLAEGKLFDGKTLGNWKSTPFAGHGQVEVEDGAIVMGVGNDLTGITWSGDVIRMNYEIQLQAMRVDGSDFFCALTFPVGDDPCSFVVGGWGGSLVGISSLDGFDAANNETTQFMGFEKGKWYKIKVAVTPGRIRAWINDKQMADVDTKDRKVGVRWEVEKSIPLGIATFQTKGAVKDIVVWRK